MMKMRPFLSRLCLVGLMALSCTGASRGSEGEVKVIDLRTNDTVAIFPDERAGFGPNFPEDGMEGRIVYADPKYGCGKLNNKVPERSDQYVWILLISRGGDCQFADKVINAQKHNFSAAIVHNSHNYSDCNSQLTIMGGANGSLVNIPSVFIGCLDGDRLANQYSYQRGMNYIVRVTARMEIDYKLYLWPFAIVVGVCFILVMVFLVFKFIRDHTRQRRNRLSNKHLKKIPVRKFKKGDYYDTCAICLEEYEEGEKIRVLPCDHVYHTKCIDPWLTKNKKTCPVCKRRVIPRGDADSDSESDGDRRGARGTSENTPLLGSSSTTARQSGSQYGGEDGASGGPVSTQAILSGPPSSEADHSSRLMEEAETRVSRSERRRRRRERRNQSDPVEEEAQGLLEESGREEAANTSREHKRLRKEQRRKRRAERAEREKAVAGETEQPQAPLMAEEEGFVSAQSSFREEPLLEEGAVGGSPVEDYVNPSYSESQEVLVTKGKREMNQLV